MRKLALLLFTLPMLAHAMGEGTWQASSIGITLANRGVVASSSQLGPTEPVSG